jgi:ABC-type bacteriocin/lantibiotic exporter with double-glycine peptidase domain
LELPDEQKLEDEMEDNCNTFNNIRFENVSFKYPGHDLYVLKNWNYQM